jgi:hypothetical protein
LHAQPSGALSSAFAAHAQGVSVSSEHFPESHPQLSQAQGAWVSSVQGQAWATLTEAPTKPRASNVV